MAGWALCAVAIALPATARYVKNLDVAVDTPVYALPVEATVPDAPLHYVLRWAGLPVATASIEMHALERDGSVRMEGFGATHPVLDWIYPYRFWGDARVATAPFGPDRFTIDECKNRRHDRTEVRYASGGPDVGSMHGTRHRKGRVKEYRYQSDNAFDIPTATFLLMNLDYTEGATYELDTFTGKSRYLLRARVAGREERSWSGTSHAVWRLELSTRELTDDDEDDQRHRETQAWVTEERPRRLLYASSQTFVGAITIELSPAGDSPGSRVTPRPSVPGMPCR
ncbi:MAG: DUF3108 domain-containing protein [Myxococcota bacterium]